MAGAIAGLPAQLRGAAERLPSIPVPTGGPWDAVIVLGMGGSAIGADVVRAAFASRRKMLANALAAGLGVSLGAAREAATMCGVDPARRAETLSIEEFVALTSRL
jgi:glucose-6-phosphate isomerase